MPFVQSKRLSFVFCVFSKGENKPQARQSLSETSEQAADVLENAVLAFPKLKVGGRIIFNNYSHGSSDAIKKAVDAFATIYSAKLKWCGMTHPQNLFTKTAD